MILKTHFRSKTEADNDQTELKTKLVIVPQAYGSESFEIADLKENPAEHEALIWMGIGGKCV